MNWFHNLSIKRKMVLIVLFISTVAVVLACAAFVISELITFPSKQRASLTVRATVFAVRSTAALSFERPDEATEVLRAMASDPRILYAGLYDKNGLLFAKYVRAGYPQELPGGAPADGSYSGRDYSEVVQPVVLDGKRVGTISVCADLEELYSRLRLYGMIVTLVILGGVGVTFLLSAWLQQVISVPILMLANTAKAVTERHDYAARAQKFTHDELGALTDAFNEMLAQIQQRDVALEQARADLEKRVDERTGELKSAMEKQKTILADLERSNRELEQFAYVASHDLQEPLRMVSGFTQLLADRYKGRLDKDADEYINFATDGAHRMRALIHDLLQYSRVGTRGKGFGLIDCETAMTQVLMNLHVAIEEQHAEVTHDPLPKVIGDDVQIGALLQNLVSNALKFHGERTVRVHVAAVRQGGDWLFSVRDNGIGLAKEHFDRIFEIFQRLHSHAKYPGTGIGLAICKKIVERHGGRIWVESELGKGSTFFFTIGAR